MPAPPPPAPSAPAPLEFKGQPLVLPLHCTEEDIIALGLTCSEDERCPVYLDLTDIEAAGTKIFVTGNLHTDSVTSFSILLGK